MSAAVFDGFAAGNLLDKQFPELVNNNLQPLFRRFNVTVLNAGQLMRADACRIRKSNC